MSILTAITTHRTVKTTKHARLHRRRWRQTIFRDILVTWANRKDGDSHTTFSLVDYRWNNSIKRSCDLGYNFAIFLMNPFCQHDFDKSGCACAATKSEVNIARSCTDTFFLRSHRACVIKKKSYQTGKTIETLNRLQHVIYTSCLVPPLR